MKKTIAILFLVFVVLLLAAQAFGQSVTASQIKKKTDGGLTADSSNALAVGVYRGTSAPASPVTGQLWCDTTTTPATWKAYNGSTWEAAPSAAGLTQADLSSFPANPTDGQLLWVRSLKRLLIYDATAAAWYYMNEPGKKASTTYSLETAGYSSAFLTAPDSAPTLAVGTGTSTAGSHVCAATFFNATGGETLPGPSSSPVTTTAAQAIGISSIPTGGDGVVGRRVYCSKAGTSTPLFLVATIADNSTTTATATGADSTHPVTAPDVDFSAPIPSGWTVRRPGGDSPTYGGCGSTGTSLLCSTVAFAPNGASHSGVRLGYYVTDESGYWFAKFKIKRVVVGFTGTSGSYQYSIIFPFVASAIDVDAPLMRGTGGYSGGTAVGAYWVSYTPAFARHTRAAGAAWAWGNASGASQYRLPFTDPAAPLWFGWVSEDTGPSARMLVSGNGKDWNNFATEFPGQVLRWVGVTAEATGNGGIFPTGNVIEISDFTVESWP